MQHPIQPEQPDQNAIPLNDPNRVQLQMQAQQLLAVSQQLRIEADNVAAHARQVELHSRELTDQAEQAQQEATRLEQRVLQLETRLGEPALDTSEQQQQLRIQLQDQLFQARDRVRLAQARFTELQAQAQQAQMQARAAQTHSEQLRIHADRLQQQAQGQANEPQLQPQDNIRINLPQQGIHVDIHPQVPAQDQEAAAAHPHPPNIRININPQNLQDPHVFIGDPNGVVIRHQIPIEVNRAGPTVTPEVEPDHADWLQDCLGSLHRLTTDELHKLDPNEDICPICYDAFNDDNDEAHRSDKTVVRVPQCGHVFDLECLELWVKDHVTCPYCQRNLRR